jgi:hypothetical protein
MKYTKEYLEMGHIGTYAESAFHGLKVYEIDEHDYKIRFMWFYNGAPDSCMTTVKINMTAAGRPYFTTRGHRVYLDEITREEGGGSWL